MPINALATLIKYWKPIVCLLTALLLYGYGYKNGGDTERAGQDAALSLQRANNLKVNNEVSDGLQKKYTALRRRYDDIIRMRPPGGLRNTNPSGGYNGEAGAAGLHGELYTPIATLMLQADLQTRQLIACQEWIRKQ